LALFSLTETTVDRPRRPLLAQLAQLSVAIQSAVVEQAERVRPALLGLLLQQATAALWQLETAARLVLAVLAELAQAALADLQELLDLLLLLSLYVDGKRIYYSVLFKFKVALARLAAVVDRVTELTQVAAVAAEALVQASWLFTQILSTEAPVRQQTVSKPMAETAETAVRLRLEPTWAAAQAEAAQVAAGYSYFTIR
jgi:hypothetical protein